MRLIDLFSDYIRNKKDLLEYIEKRRDYNEVGEFSDEQLRLAKQKLERLKEESSETYEKMHQLLEEYYRQDQGHFVEYPINFLKQILKMYENHVTVEQIVKSYEEGLSHCCRDAY